MKVLVTFVLLNTLTSNVNHMNKHTIAYYHTYSYVHGMEEVEQFVCFMAGYELKTFLDEVYESGVTHDCEFDVTIILNHCIDDFSDNIYVVDYNKRVNVSQESNNILQEEDDESISMGMSMHPQEEDKKDKNKGEIKA
jgi:beta-glucanase (GH16 family)